ncbi:glycosyltransferase family 2 protein [Sphingobacterium anhuiense]|uniref:glycosyltransferase family 2 protein n=1 Tax=Sphingobacterium anhuiense TaxID=493780 RepID=UPI003C2B2421
MIQNPETSILIPTFNNGKFLIECIGSILKQEYQNYEIIIIDDHSTDNTELIVNSLMTIDKRIKYFKNAVEKKGIVSSLNFGIELCKGDFIARMDADDIMLGQRLKDQITFLKQNFDFSGVGSSMQKIDYTGTFLGDSLVRTDQKECEFLLLFCNVFVHPTMTIRKDILLKNKYRKRYSYCEDFEMWVRLSRKYKLRNLPQVHLGYRIYDSSSRNANALNKQRYNVLKLLSENLDFHHIQHDERELLIHYSIFNLNNYIGTGEEVNNWLNKIFESEKITKKFNKIFIQMMKSSILLKLKLKVG